MIDINLEKYPNLIIDKQVISVLRWFKNNKIYSLNRSVIQDPYINRTILVDTQGQEKNLFSSMDNFFKEYKLL